jgi:predicted permease
LLRPLPFPASEQLVTIYNSYPKAGVDRDGASIANYYERRGSIPAFSHVSIFRHGTAIIGDAGVTERQDVLRVSPEFFATLGVEPRIGRAFRDDETTYQTDGVAILTDADWRQRFNADPAVLGRAIRVNGVQRTIVGVLPPRFHFLSSDARIILPLSSDPGQRLSEARHSGTGTEMVARLRPGMSIETAKSQIDAQDAALERVHPEAKIMAEAGFHSRVLSLHADHVASIRPTLILMQAGVLLLLLIGGVNVVNLLLIRASGRAKELAIRQSLGAEPRHVVTQVFVETLALCAGGGILGLAVAAGGIRLLRVFGVEQLPLGAQIELDGTLALVSLLGAIGLGLVIAMPIAWHNLRGHLANALKSESRGGTSTRGVQRVRHAFIVAQVSLAFVLLAGSALLGLSLKRASEAVPGFRSEHVITGQVTLPGRSYGTETAIIGFTDRLIDAVRAQPGVTAAGVITNIPLSGNTIKSAVTVRGYVRAPGESLRGHYTYGVTGDYFTALGISVREGRVITSADVHSRARLAVVDQDFAARYWPNTSAIGQEVFQSEDERPERAFTVVGVVGSVKQADVTDSERQGAVYFPFEHRLDGSFFVVTRTAREPASLGTMLAKIVRRLDPELPVDGVRTMDARVADSLIARRSPALLAGIFACVALLLAAIGTYGVLSYAVAQRRREIGVRLALGAQPRQIGGQFLSIGVRLLGAGTVLGVAGTWMAGRLMQRVLFEVPALHPASILATAAVMSVVSLVACLVPARRASMVDPLIAMAAE